ncbi:unnamed protein product [Blepharisma stoltei]|uniref:F-box domain-containing protein n=1 Tax=Blepharisma stoltei TaxID=1481888 RepID=A0AAU9IAL7_9CILI|nr:unnamed protein product [Blepharisma stoltei]
MEELPIKLLKFILPIVGPFNQVIKLAQVCKTWKIIIEESEHYFSLQGTGTYKLQPGCFDPSCDLFQIFCKFSCKLSLAEYKLLSLDLRNINITTKRLCLVLISQPSLLKLNLANTKIPLEELWDRLNYIKQASLSKNPPETIDLPLEVLKFSNNKSSSLGYESLVSLFPNLKKLYAGNTSTTLENFKEIVKNLKNLELLDLTYCPKIENLNIDHNELQEMLHGSKLKRLFIKDIDSITSKCLESHGIDINSTSVGDILYKIKENADLKKLERFLSDGGDADLMSDSSLCIWNYPQMQFIHKNHKTEAILVNTFKIMIRHGLDLSYHTTEYKNSFVNTAIFCSHLKLLKLLLSCGADTWPISDSDFELEIPSISLAASKGNLSILKLFRKKKLHLKNHFNEQFCNPICISAENDSNDLFKLLLENSFPIFPCHKHPNILIISQDICKNFATVEHYKLLNSIPKEIIHEAIQYYIIKHKEKIGIALIEYLGISWIKKEEAKIVKNKENSLVPEIGTDSHKPLIILAAENYCVKILKFLVKNGCDVEAEDNFGWTALIASAASNYADLIAYLYKNGADINRRDKAGRTALHQAAQGGHKAVVEELIRLKAMLSPICAEGYSPLDLAQINNRTEVCAILKHFGANASKHCELF